MPRSVCSTLTPSDFVQHPLLGKSHDHGSDFHEGAKAIYDLYHHYFGNHSSSHSNHTSSGRGNTVHRPHHRPAREHRAVMKHRPREEEGDGTTSGDAGYKVTPPPMLRSHIQLHTRQYFRFKRSYVSDWRLYTPFSTASGTGYNYANNWQFDTATTSVAGAAYDVFAFSFRWFYGPQTTSGSVPLISMGAPANYAYQPLTPLTYAIGEGNWGQACADLAILCQILQYWRVSKIGFHVERLPENINVAGTDNNSYSQPGVPSLSNVNYGKFILGPWDGRPGWFSYASDGLAAGVNGGCPNKTNLTGGYASNMFTALESDAWPQHRQHARLAPGNQHPDTISMTVAPVLPILTSVTTPSSSTVVLSGFQGPRTLDIYDWANGTAWHNGFVGKIMWLNQAPIGAASNYASMQYRVKFTMEVEAFGAQPYTEMLIPTALVEARGTSSMEATKAVAAAVIKARQAQEVKAQADLAAATSMLQLALPHAAPPDSISSLESALKRQRLDPLPPSSLPPPSPPSSPDSEYEMADVPPPQPLVRRNAVAK